MEVLRARDLARAELTRQITDTARRQLATAGAQGLSLRAVAREMGLASSALYRYFSSRDHLLTALIIDAYNAIGETAERVDTAERGAGAGVGSRWLAVCRAVRGWALDHQHEFALVYGSPVVGYRAPSDTVGPATRTARVLADILATAIAEGVLRPPDRPIPEPRLVTREVRALAGEAPEAPYEDVPERAMVLLTNLVGAINFELFGHLHNTVTDYDRYFDAVIMMTAAIAGLDVPLEPAMTQESATRSARSGLQ
ncbi:MAG: TetR/AcrR family transcriptional regulator [Actinobacteria bacterium]|nr:TetR/AcrR family transcriptional regulator [Actinomycetota bacterium]